jgi:hypothetical protein
VGNRPYSPSATMPNMDDDPTVGLEGAAGDDPLLLPDARGRVGLGKLAGEHRRFVARAHEEHIVLTPCVVVSARHPLATPMQEAVTSDNPLFLELDGRNRIALGPLTGGHRRFLATVQGTGQIVLTRAHVIAADHPLYAQLDLAQQVGPVAQRPARPGR